MTPKELTKLKGAIRGERMCVSVAGLNFYDFVAVFDDGSLWVCGRIARVPGCQWEWHRIPAPEVES